MEFLTGLEGVAVSKYVAFKKVTTAIFSRL